MGTSFEAIVYYLIAVDAIVSMVVAWSGRGESLNKQLGLFSKYFPLTRGWTLYYVVLVLWLGFALTRVGVI